MNDKGEEPPLRYYLFLAGGRVCGLAVLLGGSATVQRSKTGREKPTITGGDDLIWTGAALVSGVLVVRGPNFQLD